MTSALNIDLGPALTGTTGGGRRKNKQSNQPQAPTSKIPSQPASEALAIEGIQEGQAKVYKEGSLYCVEVPASIAAHPECLHVSN